MSFNDIVSADQRLVILQALDNDPGYDLNESILQALLGQYGHKVSRDKVRTELRWLEEQGLVSIKLIFEIHVATLTGRGSDVAKGLAIVDGINRPRPRHD
ncbi:MAG: ArsR family transcriptional regulator [Desulfuromonadales bacterium]|nr:ArsR family transcriptional regulator [Desulfuromonadales bacterium]